jgi:hypothetical protein
MTTVDYLFGDNLWWKPKDFEKKTLLDAILTATDPT